MDDAHSHFKEAALKSFVQVTRYYYFNGVRVALRKDNRVLYLAGDQLGTTSVVVDGSGIRVAESRHRPYGEVRWPAEDGDFPTDYRFTGQKLDSYVGLYAMGARWYDPYLARWLSADALVPWPSSPQSLNRYTYGLNGPARFVDPTGLFSEWQLCDWFGDNWRSLFDKIWQTLLEKAEFGDVILYGDNQSAMFLQTESGSLTMWSMSTADDFSGKGEISIDSVANAQLIALYRSRAANPKGGPSSSQELEQATDAAFRDFRLIIAWANSASDAITLGYEWYRSPETGQNVQMREKCNPFGEFGNADWITAGLVGLDIGGALAAGATISEVFALAVGLPGIVALTLEIWLWATWDTSFILHSNGPGKPPVVPVPTPP